MTLTLLVFVNISSCQEIITFIMHGTCNFYIISSTVVVYQISIKDFKNTFKIVLIRLSYKVYCQNKPRILIKTCVLF